jgi:flagellar hook-associated protein 3 FlgL
MSSIPSNLARVPNLLISGMQLRNLNRTNVDLVKIQAQLSTGMKINKPSDDGAAAAVIGVMDSDVERSEQYLRNMDHAGSVLNVLDQSLQEVSELLLDVQVLSSEQINSDPDTRAAQAVVVESIINELTAITNRQFQGLYLYGGERTGAPPMDIEQGGLRYSGSGAGLLTDLGQGMQIPITISAEDALGSLSARVRGQQELSPDATSETLVGDLKGARGVGVDLGAVEFSFDGSDFVSVDLSQANTVGDLADMLDAAIMAYELDRGRSVLDGTRVTLDGERLAFEMAGTGGGGDPELVFRDVGAATTAADLGLSQQIFQAGTNELSLELNPFVTMRSRIDSVPSLQSPLGSIRLTNGVQTREIDLSGAETVQDVKNIIEAEQLGVRVVISDDGQGLDLLNEWSGQDMSVAEVDDGYGQTATDLGIRTLIGGTALEDYNFGRGVDIVSGNVNPHTGLPDPTRDVDFVVTLSDGSSFSVNLQPEDSTTQAVVDRINVAAAAAAAAGDIPAGSFSAALALESNGLEFTDNAGGAGQLSIDPENGSFAAEDLGLLDGTWDSSSAILTGSDRTSVRVDSAFGSLLALKDALLSNDVRGITFAGERLSDDVNRAAQARAIVGGRANRVEVAAQREEDRQLQTISVRSQLRDLDYTEASIRYTLLQTQLQAGLTTAGQSQSMSLINFLG